MQQASPIKTLPLADLEIACRQETRRFRNNEASDSRFCLEIFHRALLHIPSQLDGANALLSTYSGENPSQANQIVPVYTDEAARTVLVSIYTEFIKAHINPSTISPSSIEDIVQQVWMRFWRAANKGLIFPSLEAALTYLKRTIIATLIEGRRRERVRWREESLQQMVATTNQETLTDVNVDLFEEHVRRRFRQRCNEVLTDSLDKRVFWMRHSMGLPPREIAQKLAHDGTSINGQPPTSRIVSDLLDRIFKRLALDAEIRDLIGGD